MREALDIEFSPEHKALTKEMDALFVQAKAAGIGMIVILNDKNEMLSTQSNLDIADSLRTILKSVESWR
jgi:hypothetical protein